VRRISSKEGIADVTPMLAPCRTRTLRTQKTRHNGGAYPERNRLDSAPHLDVELEIQRTGNAMPVR
jgi:hypothetical protein